MIYVVEGIDRVGKTTLCEMLSKSTSTKVFKHDCSFFPYDKMDNDNETDKMMQLVELATTTNSDIIFDRFHLSDFAYGITKRHYDGAVALKNFLMIDRKLSEVGAVLIVVRPESIDKSSEEHGSDLREVHSYISIAYSLSHMKKLETMYDMFDDTLDAIYEKAFGGFEF